MKRGLTWLVSAPLLALVGLYKYVISPFTPPSCRHYPTCSSYAGEAVREWGPWKGSWLALKRIGNRPGAEKVQLRAERLSKKT
jgi:putative component of membrane protein insertase Oxa1/YidC/SpoIIIJ protein YidD